MINKILIFFTIICFCSISIANGCQKGAFKPVFNRAFEDLTLQERIFTQGNRIWQSSAILEDKGFGGVTSAHVIELFQGVRSIIKFILTHRIINSFTPVSRADNEL